MKPYDGQATLPQPLRARGARPRWGWLVALALLPSSSASATLMTVAPGEVGYADNGLCSLAEAIANANTDAQLYVDCPAGFFADTIELAAGSVYTLTSALEPIASVVEMIGFGAVIERDAGLPCVLDNAGNASEFRILAVFDQAAGPESLALSDVTLRNGCADGTGNNDGGGIAVLGATLYLDRVTIESCVAYDKSGGLDVGAHSTVTVFNSTISGNFGRKGGGGIGSGMSMLYVEGSTVSGNTAGGSGGGGIGNLGVATIVNSTISGNTSTGTGGGGIGNGTGASLQIMSSTVWSNTATVGLGGGIGNAGTIEIKNSIVGNSPAGEDCANLDTFSAVGANFDTDGSCASVDPGFVTATLAELAISELRFGGPTRTHVPGAGSIAVDAAIDCTYLDGITVVERDQRGVIRPEDGDHDTIPQCDSGAVEREESMFEDGFETGDTTGWSQSVD